MQSGCGIEAGCVHAQLPSWQPCHPPTQPPAPQIRFPLWRMGCGSDSCTIGQYQMTYFAALSRFDSEGDFIFPQQNDNIEGNWLAGDRITTDAFPTSRIYIGELRARAVS